MARSYRVVVVLKNYLTHVALQAKLRASDVGGTVEQVEALIKRHDAMDKLIQSQEQKLTALLDYGNRLIEQNHFDKDNIADRMDAVAKR